MRDKRLSRVRSIEFSLRMTASNSAKVTMGQRGPGVSVIGSGGRFIWISFRNSAERRRRGYNHDVQSNTALPLFPMMPFAFCHAEGFLLFADLTVAPSLLLLS